MVAVKLRLMLEGGFLAVSGVCLLVSSLVSYFHVHNFVSSGIMVDASIIRMIDYSDTKHYPIYGFIGDDERIACDTSTFLPNTRPAGSPNTMCP